VSPSWWLPSRLILPTSLATYEQEMPPAAWDRNGSPGSLRTESQSRGGLIVGSVGQDFIAGGDFFGAIMAGFLLGLGGDYVFGTRPVLVVSGIIAGSITGFFVMFRHLKKVGG